MDESRAPPFLPPFSASPSLLPPESSACRNSSAELPRETSLRQLAKTKGQAGGRREPRGCVGQQQGSWFGWLLPLIFLHSLLLRCLSAPLFLNPSYPEAGPRSPLLYRAFTCLVTLIIRAKRELPRSTVPPSPLRSAYHLQTLGLPRLRGTWTGSKFSRAWMEIDVNVPRKQLPTAPIPRARAPCTPPSEQRRHDRPCPKEPTPGESAEVVSEVVPREMDYDGVVGRIRDRCLAPAVPRIPSLPLHRLDFAGNRSLQPRGVAWQIASPLFLGNR